MSEVRFHLTSGIRHLSSEIHGRDEGYRAASERVRRHTGLRIARESHRESAARLLQIRPQCAEIGRAERCGFQEVLRAWAHDEGAHPWVIEAVADLNQRSRLVFGR